MKSEFLLACMLIFSVAFAQDSSTHDGKWHFEFTSDSGYPVTGTLIIQGRNGIWASNASSKNNPCIGRPTPITVRTDSIDDIAFDINGSKVIHGCPDNEVQLKQIDTTHLEGTINKSIKIKLTRE